MLFRVLSAPFEILAQEPPAVLVFMTINAEVLPVGPVGGIVIVVPIFVVHRKKIPVRGIELSAAFGADQAVDPEGLLPVICIGRGGRQTPQLPDDLFGAFFSRRLMRLRFSDLYPLPVSQTDHLS